jgi:hypothetical protein
MVIFARLGEEEVSAALVEEVPYPQVDIGEREHEREGM